MSSPQTVRDLRRLWKPHKERLNSEQDSHPTAIRIHRAFSWLAQAEDMENEQNRDIVLICQWIAFNSLYGQWDEDKQEPVSDRFSWKEFLGRIIKLDSNSHIENSLVENKRLVMRILEDEYLSKFFWEDPTEIRAGKSKKTMYDARTWYLEKRWTMVIDRLAERIYLMRCQIMHGASTYGGKLNRTSLKYCSIMLGHLLQSIFLVMIESGANEDWGSMCYKPLR